MKIGRTFYLYLPEMTQEQETFIAAYHAAKRKEATERHEAYEARRQQFDHERYLREREERLAKQRSYYQANKEEIRGKRKFFYLKYGSFRKRVPTSQAGQQTK